MPSEKITFHNKFDILVKNAKTGEIKQKVRAYNVILDQLFTKLSLPYGTEAPDLMAKIAFGSGTGTPAVSDTGLFAKIAEVASTNIATTCAYPTSNRQVSITLAASDYNGDTITEVGLEMYFMNTSNSASYYLITHAMLKDSEGNQISINKTDTDVIIITATLYVTMTLSGFGANGIYPPAENNSIIWFLFNSGVYGCPDFHAGFSCRDLAASNQLYKNWVLPKASSIQSHTSSAPGKIDMPLVIFANTEGVSLPVKCLGLPGIGAFHFPDHDVFPPLAIDHLAIGTGDGVAKDFKIGAPYIMEGSVHIFVNSAEVTSGWSVDIENNESDVLSLYWTASLTGASIISPSESGGTTLVLDRLHVGGGAASGEGGVSGGKNYFTQFGWMAANTEYVHGSIYLYSGNPMVIDLGQSRSCNSFFVNNYRLQNWTDTLANALVLQYSDDNINWTTVTDWVLTKVVNGTPKKSYANGCDYTFTPHTARYWRFYSSAGTLSQSYQDNGTIIDGSAGYNQGTLFGLGLVIPGLHFDTPPAAGATIEASYSIDVPYHTPNNQLKFSYSILLQRG